MEPERLAASDIARFAAAWSLGSPASQLINIRSLLQSGFLWYIPPSWRLSCLLVLGLMEAALFIGLATFAYVMWHRLVFGNLHFRRLEVGILWGVVVHALAFWTIFLLGHPHLTRDPDWRTLTLLGVVEDFRIWTIVLIRLPYFLGTAGALWYLTSAEFDPFLRGWSAGRTCARGLLIGIPRLGKWPSV